jgi:ParB family chromosome partitioning protein
MAAKKTSVNPEFLYIPVEKIVVLEQVRSNINTESESFKSLMQSIKDKGILEPLIVTAQVDGTYLLICGERRLVAARQLELESVPVRIIEAGKEAGETITLQLTENLQREDLNPMDQARGILAYIQAKHPVLSAGADGQAGKVYDVDGVISDLIKYNRKPDTLSEEMVFTVNTIIEISAKSYPTLFRTISLLKLPLEIQAAIQIETLPVSQGYLFAANLDCPDCIKIFETVIKTPVTNAVLEKMLTAHKTIKPATDNTKPISVKKQVESLESIIAAFDRGLETYKREDVEKYLYKLQVFCDHIQQEIPKIPYGKKKPPQV